MFKLMGKEINEILGVQIIPIWTHDRPFNFPAYPFYLCFLLCEKEMQIEIAFQQAISVNILLKRLLLIYKPNKIYGTSTCFI